MKVPTEVKSTLTAVPDKQATVNGDPTIAEVEIPQAPPVKLMARLVPLSVPVVRGKFETTLILYVPPEAILAGIVDAIVPEFAVEVRVPITVGKAKLPAASDISAE